MKILIAEDEPDIRLLLEEVLTMWGYEVVAAQDGNEAYQILQSENAPNIAILDWKMPGLEGVEVCRKVRKIEEDCYTYIIILTAQNSDEDLVCGMEAGADDYIVKPFSLNELRGRINAGRRIIELNQELLAARKTLQVKATHDSLTGLLNREEILDMLSKELPRSERDGECVSIIMADIDHFKMVNDTYGHLAGDGVLRITAKKMHYMMRTSQSSGRSQINRLTAIRLSFSAAHVWFMTSVSGIRPSRERSLLTRGRKMRLIIVRTSFQPSG